MKVLVREYDDLKKSTGYASPPSLADTDDSSVLASFGKCPLLGVGQCDIFC